jgi:hypothetical protein
MRKGGAWGLAAALVVGVAATAAFAVDDEADGDNKPAPVKGIHLAPWLAERVNAENHNAQEEHKPAAKPKSPPAPKAEPVDKPVKKADEAAAIQARERATLGRRLAVIDKLKEIAERTHDDELIRRADELEERAWTAFGQHTAYLRGTGELESRASMRPAGLDAADAPISVPRNERGTGVGAKEVNP